MDSIQTFEHDQKYFQVQNSHNIYRNRKCKSCFTFNVNKHACRMIEMFYCFVAHNEAKVFSFFLLRGRLEKGTITEHSSYLAVINLAKLKM